MSLFQEFNRFCYDHPVVPALAFPLFVAFAGWAGSKIGKRRGIRQERKKQEALEHEAIKKHLFREPFAPLELMSYPVIDASDPDSPVYDQRVEILSGQIELRPLFPSEVSERLVDLIQEAIETCTDDNPIIALRLDELLEGDDEKSDLLEEFLCDWHRHFEPRLREALEGVLESQHDGKPMSHEKYFPVLVFMPRSANRRLRILVFHEDTLKRDNLPTLDSRVRVDEMGAKVINPKSPEISRLKAAQKVAAANDNKNSLMEKHAVVVHKLVEPAPA